MTDEYIINDEEQAFWERYARDHGTGDRRTVSEAVEDAPELTLKDWIDLLPDPVELVEALEVLEERFPAVEPGSSLKGLADLIDL